MSGDAMFVLQKVCRTRTIFNICLCLLVLGGRPLIIIKTIAVVVIIIWPKRKWFSLITGILNTSQLRYLSQTLNIVT